MNTQAVFFFKNQSTIFAVKNLEKCYSLPTGKYVSALVKDLDLVKDYITEKDILDTLGSMLNRIDVWGDKAKNNMDLVNIEKLKLSELLLTVNGNEVIAGERYKAIPSSDLLTLLKR
ncbi:hypothetical protein [Photobacterium damselae]|uniref:hypothetical protein n=1 Tax=Photobacterium damselae TaxID=38293 RepID=UPI0040684F85